MFIKVNDTFVEMEECLITKERIFQLAGIPDDYTYNFILFNRDRGSGWPDWQLFDEKKAYYHDENTRYEFWVMQVSTLGKIVDKVLSQVT